MSRRLNLEMERSATGQLTGRLGGQLAEGERPCIRLGLNLCTPPGPHPLGRAFNRRESATPADQSCVSEARKLGHGVSKADELAGRCREGHAMFTGCGTERTRLSFICAAL